MARILIVEDEALIAMQIEDWVRELGHVPVGPEHSLEAGLAQAAGPIDAAIVDVTLGATASYPICDALADRGIPFVMATGRSAADLDRRYVATPPLIKPFDFGKFKAAVGTLVGGRAS